MAGVRRGLEGYVADDFRESWVRYGIRAFDTSAYYGPSEIVLGGVLKALKDEFPRGSYKLVAVAYVSAFSGD